MPSDVMLTLLGMALVTYATRAGGHWLMSRIPHSPAVERWLQHIPGAVLVAIIAPTLFSTGPAEILAAGGTVLVARVTKNVLLAMVVGVGMVWVLRHFL